MAAGYVPAFTKCLVPELPASFVARPALRARLDELVDRHPVTIVSGFPGSGKSVLVTDWCRSKPTGAVAWLSCDATDISAGHFWTALVYALRTFDSGLGADSLDLIEPGSVLGDDVVAALVNDMASLGGRRTLVVDDVQLVGPAALDAFGRLVERLPPSVRFVCCARSDPQLPIHRWRATGRLGELRSADLRLDAGDVQRVVAAMGVDINEATATLLADRTEGWAAGVQLAALSMRGDTDPDEFVRAFAGSDRNVTDFLVGEVLNAQPLDRVEFMMAISILPDFDADICNALTGRTDATDVLRELEVANLLLIPLDNERTLYRYHALFQELLARLLLARDADRYRSLQGTASRWYEARGDFTRALRHAVAANDAERVFRLMRSGLVGGFFTGRGDLVRAWVSDLDLVGLDSAPGLMVEYVLALELVGEWDEVRIWLERLEQSLPQDREPQLAARYAAARALLCAQEGDFDQSRALCEEARSGPRKDDFAVAALSLVLIRLSTYLRDYDASRRYHAEVTAPTSDAPPLMRMLAEGAYADCEWDEGNLRGAVTRAERALADLTQLGADAHLGAFDTLRTLALHAYEQDRLDDAELLVERYLQLSSGVRAPYELLALLDLARIWWARGERDAAFETLTRARLPLPPSSRSPLVQRIDALESRWRAEQGDLARALTLVDAMEDPWMRESVRVRCDIAAEDWERARARHDALRAPAPTIRTALHDAVLTARIDLGVGVDAVTAVGPVLERGRAQSFLRTLVDEGPVFARALEDAARRQPGDDYVDALLATISAAARRVPVTRVVLPGNVTLSEREATVLRLLATRLTTREIAAELFVSQNTLKTHLKSIYRKLGADSRRTAVEAAWAYGVL